MSKETDKALENTKKIAGKRIKELREFLNLSQENFANCIDISKQTIAGAENDNRIPTIETLIRIVNKFGVSLDWLCGYRDFDKLSSVNLYTGLRDMFNIKSEMRRATYLHPMGEECLTLSIDEDLYDFIKALETAEKYKKENNLSDELFEKMLDEIKIKFDEQLKNRDTSNVVMYQLIDPKELTIEEIDDTDNVPYPMYKK